MRKLIVFLVALSLVVPVLVFAADEWSVGGVVDKTKVYDTDEAHGYLMRVDVKRPNGKIKKIYVKKSTKVIDAAGKKKSLGSLKIGNPVQIKYNKSGDDFVAIQVMIL